MLPVYKVPIYIYAKDKIQAYKELKNLIRLLRKKKTGVQLNEEVLKENGIPEEYLLKELRSLLYKTTDNHERLSIIFLIIQLRKRLKYDSQKNKKNRRGFLF